MLKSVTIKNLQAFDDSHAYTIPFTKETVLIGANNAGKSTVFNALNMVRTLMLKGQFEYSNGLYNLQNFDEAVHMHDLGRTISIIVEIEDGTDTFRYEALANRGGLRAIAVTRNGASISFRQGAETRRHARSIWYFSPIRSLIPYQLRVGNYSDDFQPLNSAGMGVNQFLLQKFTEQDPRWGEAKEWLNKIDSNLVMFKTPLRHEQGSVETTRKYGDKQADINLSLQGTGIQNAATIVAAVIFSPKGSTICIEEPESFLHARSQEVLVDLFNYATNELDKQIIFSTHSWDILKHFIGDLHGGIGRSGSRDASKHKITDSSSFSLVTFKQNVGADKVSVYDLKGKKYDEERRYIAELLG